MLISALLVTIGISVAYLIFSLWGQKCIKIKKQVTTSLKRQIPLTTTQVKNLLDYCIKLYDTGANNGLFHLKEGLPICIEACHIDNYFRKVYTKGKHKAFVIKEEDLDTENYLYAATYLKEKGFSCRKGLTVSLEAANGIDFYFWREI